MTVPEAEVNASPGVPPGIEQPPHTAAEIEPMPEMAQAGRLAVHGAGATMIAQAIKFLLRFGSAIALGRLLTPSEFGIVAMVSPVLAFVATLNDLGFAQAIVQRRDLTPQQVSGLFWANALASLLLTVLLLLLSPLVGWLYGEPRTIGITMVMAGAILLGGFGIVPNAILSRQMRFVVASAIDILTLVVTVVVSIGLAVAGFGYWSLVLGQLASTASGMAAVFIASRWRPRRWRRDAQIGSLMTFGANLTGVNLATYFSMMADNIIVGAVAGKTSLGLYERSYTLALQPLGQLMAPLGRVAVPLLSRFGDDPDRQRATYVMMLQLGTMLTAPAMIVCTAMASDVIFFLLGAKWVAAAPVFGWICFGGIFASIFSSTGWLFTVQDRTGEQLRLSIATACISIASFVLGVHWGAAGVAAAAALSFVFLQTPLMLFGLTRRGGVTLGHFARALWPASIAGALALLVVTVARRAPFPGNLFLAAILAYTSFWAAMLVLPGGPALRSQLLRLRTMVGGSNRRNVRA